MFHRLRSLFELYDADGDGFVTVEDLMKKNVKLGGPMTHEEAEQFMKEKDIDEDGKLCWDEFLLMTVFPNIRKQSQKREYSF
ncbi:hypothetical protein ACOME3_001441 [Neoechinorhynchus agilis]